MTTDFFAHLNELTPTRVWINNPTTEEVGKALAQGAVGCTTNPAFGASLLKRRPEEIRPLVASAARQFVDTGEGAGHVQLALVASIAARFRPQFDASAGRTGYVSIQGDPERDTDQERIVLEAEQGRAVAPNVIPKIPATRAGLEAFETLVARGCPTIVTEVFSLAQLIEINERYLRTASAAGVRPNLFISPISGIFGDHLKAVAARDGLAVAPAILELAGVALARACDDICRDREYPSTLLVGGARVPFDLTGLIGRSVHATINWSTYEALLATDRDPAWRIGEPIDAPVTETLKEQFADVRTALDPAGLAVEDFADFPPVQFFRQSFVKGWQAVREAIADAQREGAAATA